MAIKRIIHIFVGRTIPFLFIALYFLAIIINANRDYILDRFFKEYLVGGETKPPKNVKTTSSMRVEQTEDGLKHYYVTVSQGLTVSDSVSGNIIRVSKFNELTKLLGLLYRIIGFLDDFNNLIVWMGFVVVLIYLPLYEIGLKPFLFS